MSKTHSINRRAPRLFLVAAVAAAALTCGCSRVDVHSERVRGTAYIRVDEVIKHHPLYAQLDQLNDAMAAISLEASAPHAPLSPDEIARQTQALNKELHDAQNRANSIIQQKQQQYANDERAADVAALKAAGIDPAAAGIGAQMSATSQQQAAEAVAAARQDLQSYQQSVIAQDNAAAQSIAQQLSKGADEKFRARAEQYQQAENDLSLRLSEQDAPQRLALKTKLNNLAMDEATRKQVASDLDALNKKEADQVNGLRKQHAKALEDYRAQLRADTNGAIQKQLGSIRSQTQAKLSAHRDAVGQQLQGLGAAPVPRVNIPPDVQQKLGQIHADYTKRFQADAQSVVAQYTATKADLDQQFAALHGQDVGATGAQAKQLRDLQKRHDDLQAQIQAQIQREADRLAKEMGFSVVFDDVKAAPGGYDLTNDLIHDVESLHE